ncbi:MAG: ECF transporter S component [Candidatus Bathyarchaeota archaeon]|nr:ECF transporter S component [Candidatus Bathyarchaeota archaeon]
MSQKQEKQSPDRKRLTVIQVAVSGVMAALVIVATVTFQIPNPVTRGYTNIGDIMIFVSALTFGPVVGGIAGSVGSALADVILGYGIFAPFTFIIKGAEGTIAGLISNQKRLWRDILAVTVAGAEMVLGYLLIEYFVLGLGVAAFAEIPGNVSQVVVGGLVGVPIALLLRRTLPKSWRAQRT